MTIQPQTQTSVNSAWKNNAYSVLKYPLRMDDKHPAYVIFTALEQEVDTNGNTLQTFRRKETSQACIFHLPINGIEVEDKITYDNPDLQIIGAAIADSQISLDQAGEFVKQAITLTGEAAADAIGLLNGKSNYDVIAKVIQQVGAGNNIYGQGITAKIQRVANPHTRAIFKSVGLRSFEFTYDLIPESPEEAQMIKKIVQFFRKHAYPETSGPEGARDLVFKFPTKFDIDYRFKGKRIGHKILPCFCTGVKVHWGKEAHGTMMKDGEFNSVKLSMNFQEERTLSRKQIEDTSTDGIGY